MAQVLPKSFGVRHFYFFTAKFSVSLECRGVLINAMMSHQPVPLTCMAYQHLFLSIYHRAYIHVEARLDIIAQFIFGLDRIDIK